MNLSFDDVLRLTGGKAVREAAPDLCISGVATLAEAQPGEAAFLGNEKYFHDYLSTKASLVLIPPGLPRHPEGTALIEVENPSLAFNALVDHFMKAASDFVPGIAPGAFVDPSAKLDAAKVRVSPGAVIEADAVIGDGCDIGPGCVIGKAAVLGRDCKLHARVVVRERCILGNHVVIQPGAVIGGDGFGFLLNKETGRYETVDQVGIVEIGDNVDIGANTTIDRARFGRTVIGEGSKIDNLVMIAHNVQIGPHTVIVSQSGIAGSTKLGSYVTIAAQCGIAGHLDVGDRVVLAARSGVMNNLEAGKTYWGAPAVLFKEAGMQYAAIKHLPQAVKQLRSLQKQADEIKELIRQAMGEQDADA